jgi:gliding motility-associated-like protein
MRLLYTLFHKILCPVFLAGIILCFANQVSAQVILNGDGTPVTRVWCYEDSSYQVVGQPAGGTFSGCGVTQVGGNWYFNPFLASAGATNGATCTLTYQPPAGSATSVGMRIQAKIMITAGADQVTCDGTFYLFGDFLSTIGSFIWSWSPGAGLDDSTKKGVSGMINATQSYVFTGLNTNTGCIASDTVVVSYEAVEAEITTSKDTVCLFETFSFMPGIQDTSYRYVWYSGDGITLEGASNQHSYSRAGNFDLTLVVSNAYCSDTAVSPVHVRDFKLNLTTASQLVDRGTPVNLNTSSEESYVITSWEPKKLFSDQQAYSQNILLDTSYVFKVAGRSAYGCVDSAELMVSVNPTVFIPSSFTPNGDGRNDYFRVVSWGDPLLVRQFKVADRWGKEVWSASGSTATTGWDGTYNGTLADMGVYYYYIEVQSPQGITTAYQGDVTLIR